MEPPRMLRCSREEAVTEMMTNAQASGALNSNDDDERGECASDGCRYFSLSLSLSRTHRSSATGIRNQRTGKKNLERYKGGRTDDGGGTEASRFFRSRRRIDRKRDDDAANDYSFVRRALRTSEQPPVRRIPWVFVTVLPPAGADAGPAETSTIRRRGLVGLSQLFVTTTRKVRRGPGSPPHPHRNRTRVSCVCVCSTPGRCRIDRGEEIPPPRLSLSRTSGRGRLQDSN